MEEISPRRLAFYDPEPLMPTDPHAPRSRGDAPSPAEIADVQALAGRNVARLLAEIAAALAVPVSLAAGGSEADRYQARRWLAGVGQATQDRLAAALDRLAAQATYGVGR